MQLVWAQGLAGAGGAVQKAALCAHPVDPAWWCQPTCGGWRRRGAPL